MSKTLWIYGDSFGVDWKVDWGWHRQLAGQLNVDKVVNQCCSGCANEWSAKNFRDDQHSKSMVLGRQTLSIKSNKHIENTRCRKVRKTEQR